MFEVVAVDLFVLFNFWSREEGDTEETIAHVMHTTLN